MKTSKIFVLGLMGVVLTSCNSKVYDPQAALAEITLLGPDPIVTAINPSSYGVNGGGTVTITGQFLTHTQSVDIGGTPCTQVVIASDTSLSCVLGSHRAAVVNVVVTNTSSQTGTLINGFSYNSFLYSSTQSSANLYGYVLDSTTGSLTSAGSATACSGAYGVEINPDNTLVATACVSANQLKFFGINHSTGALTTLTGSNPVNTGSGTNPNGLKFDTTGSILYASNWANAKLESWAVSVNTGASTVSVTGPISSVSTGTNPGGIAVGKNNTLVYVANYASNTISGFMTSGGSMTAISGSPWATGAGPDGLVFHPNGKFLYSGNANASTVTAFSVDQSTGALTQLGSYAIQSATGGAGVEIDSTGTHLYATSMAAGKVNGFSINSTTGLLTALSTPNYSAQTGTNDVRIQALGGFVFTANTASNSVSAFVRDIATGILTPASPQNFTIGNGPGIIAITY
jgi:6-phosphogluconolactonase (cycloisomerase 2 family)